MLINLPRIISLILIFFLIEKCFGMGNKIKGASRKMNSLLSKEKKEKAREGGGSGGSEGQSEMPMSLLERGEGIVTGITETEKRKEKLAPSLLGTDERGKGKLVPSLLGTDERGKGKLALGDESDKGKFASSLLEITALDESENMAPSQSDSIGTMTGKEAELAPSLLDKHKKKGMASSLIGLVKKKGMAKSLLGTQEKKKGMAPSLLETEEKKGMASSLLETEEKKGMAPSLLETEEKKGMVPSLLSPSKGIMGIDKSRKGKHVKLASSLLEVNPHEKPASSHQSKIIQEHISKISGKNGSLKILFIAPNIFRSHFELNKIQIKILLEQEWVEKILLFIPEQTSEDRKDEDLVTGGKLVVQYFNPNESKGNQPIQRYFANTEWEKRTLDNAMLSYPNTNEEIFNAVFDEPTLIKALQEEHFDLGIGELWDYMAFPLFWLTGIKNFAATSNLPLESNYYRYLGFLPEIIRKGDIPEIWTTLYDDHKKDELSPHFQSIHLSKADLLERIYDDAHKNLAVMFEKNYGIKSVPTFEQLFNQARYIFVNGQPFLDFPMPEGFPQKIVHFGGITLHGHETIAAQIDRSEMEHEAISAASNKRGLIIISFGSIINTKFMPNEMFKKFVEVFKKFRKFEFIWKFDDSDVKRYHKLEGIRNVRTKMWIKQTALLANAQTKLFISHCGINSILEAVQFTIPLLCIPFMADQFYNSEALAKRGIALVVNKDNMAEFGHKMEQALQPIYKQKMMDLKGQLQEARPAEIYLQKVMEFL